MMRVDPLVSGVRAYCLCPPGWHESCDAYWNYLADRYAPDEDESVYQVGQVGLNNFAEATTP